MAVRPVDDYRAGLPLALGLGRIVGDFLFGLHPANPFVLGASVLVLGATATIAGYLPAQRAARVDPLTALRAARGARAGIRSSATGGDADGLLYCVMPCLTLPAVPRGVRRDDGATSTI